jgi:hypothetical protein
MSSAQIVLPYHNSRTLQLTGFATAPLILGAYNFTSLGKIPMSPAFAFSSTALYVMTDFTFFANVPESAWIQGLTQPAPTVQMYMSGKDSSPVLDNPISVPKYFEQYGFIKFFYPKVSPNNLSFSITGTVTQLSLLAGYPTLLAGFIITLYEVKDQGFIDKYGGASR